MKLTIRAIDIDVLTEDGPYGAYIAFSKGFNVLRLRNSSGKSTCLHLIFYALGLEAIYGGSRGRALQNALTTSLQDDEGVSHKVVQSDVVLEIENGQGQGIVIRRSITGAKSTQLITVWHDSVIGQEPQGKADSFFVGVEGSAQRERGFHTFLARFLDLKLPLVPRYEGVDVPLYLETIFPLFFVEQKGGWSALQALTPTKYRIKDVQKRAVEFVLGLEINEAIGKRLRLVEERNQIQRQWATSVSSCNLTASRVGGILRNLETALSEQGSRVPSIDAILLAEGKWWNLRNYIDHLAEEIEAFDRQVLPKNIAYDEAMQAEMMQIDGDLAKLRLEARLLYDQSLRNIAERESIDRRLASLDEDRQRSLDAHRILNLGAISLGDDSDLMNCPTCHQHLEDSINVTSHSLSGVMNLTDHVNFIDSQIAAFRAVMPVASQAVRISERQIEEIRERTTIAEERLSSLQRLTTSKSYPTAEALRKRFRLEVRLETFRQAEEDLFSMLDSLTDAFDGYQTLQKQIGSLPKGDLSFSDQSKLKKFGASVLRELREYRLESVDVDAVTMSYDTYRPLYDGFDLDGQVSASDHIRIIWAYLVSLLELARTEASSNHVGLLVFDEPWQQRVNPADFERLCNRVAMAGQYDQQVIFASALWDTHDDLKPNSFANVIDVVGRLLKPRIKRSLYTDRISD